MQKTHFFFFAFFFVSGLSLAHAQSDDCTRLLSEAANFEKNKQYDSALKKYLSAKEECGATISDSVNRQVLAVFEKIEQQRQEAEIAKRRAEANATRARIAERRTLAEKEKAERSSEANRLAALALSKIKTNPTLGRHLAAMAWEMSLDSNGRHCTEPGVISVMHSIASDADAWMYQPLKGHSGRINDIAFSPDGQFIATASDDKTLRLWNLKGQVLDTLYGHSQAVNRVVFSPDGQLLLSTGYDSTARIWSRSGSLIRTLYARPHFYSAVFSPDGRRILTTSNDSTAVIWSVISGDTIAKINSSAGANKHFGEAVFSPKGDYVMLSSSYPRFVVILDTLGIVRDTLAGSRLTGPVWFLSGGTSILYSVGKELYFKKIGGAIYDTTRSDKNTNLSIFAVDTSRNRYYTFDYNSSRMLVFERQYFFEGEDKIAKISDRVVETVFDRASLAMDGKIIVCYSYNNNIQFINIDGDLDAEYAIPAFKKISSPDGRYVLTTASGNDALLWRKNMLPKWSMTSEQFGNQAAPVFSPDGQKIFLRSRVGSTARLLDADLKLIREVKAPFAFLSESDCQFSQKGDFFAARCTDNSIRLWEPDGKLRVELRDSTLKINALAISPLGDRILASDNYGNATLWDNFGNKIGDIKTSTSQPNTATPNPSPLYRTRSSFAPNGQYFCIHGDTSVMLWDNNARPVATLHGLFRTLKFSPNGHYFIAGGSDYTTGIQSQALFNDKGKEIFSSKSAATSTQFSPDSKWCAMLESGKNGSVVVRSLKDGQVKRRISDLPGWINRFVFSPDGEHIYISYASGQNEVTQKFDFNGNKLGSFNGSISLDPEKCFLPGKGIIAFKTLQNRQVSYFQILDSDGKLIQTLEGLNAMKGVEYTTDGRFRLSVGERNKIIVWDQNGKALRTIQCEMRDINRAYFSPDGRYIVANSNYASHEIWENPESYLAKSKVLSIADLVKAGAGIEPDSVLKYGDAEVLEEVAEYYFSDRNDFENAGRFYEKLLKQKRSPQGLQQLYEISLKTGQPFDLQRFQESADPAELTDHADFLFNRKFWTEARELYEKASGIEVSAHRLIQLKNIADTLRQPFDLIRFEQLAGKPEQLGVVGDYFYNAKDWSQARKMYEMAAQMQPIARYLLPLQQIGEQPGQPPLDFNRLLNAEKYYELEQYAYYFLHARQWEKAQILFEKANNTQPSSRYLNQLQTIADSLGQPFDFDRFIQIKNAEDINNSADFFYNRREWDKARRLYDKAAEMNPVENAYIFARRVDLAFKTGASIDIEKATQSASRSFLRSAVTEMLYFAQDTFQSLKEQFMFLDVLQQLEKKLFLVDTTYATRRQIAVGYNGIAWISLFAPGESRAKLVERATLRGLELLPDEKAPENKVLKTNMPTALVLQGRFEEAWRDWYEPLKNQEYGRNNYATFRDVFLGDIKRLETEGVKHADFKKVKERLETGGGG